MSIVAGADGCPGGWIVVVRDVASGALEVRRVEELREALDLADLLGVDVPIGLADRAIRGGRDCDRAVRALLGAPRASSVFSPPARAVLRARSYGEACRANAASSPDGLKLSRQCYGILPKIREADELVTPELQRRVFEVHPEASFHALGAELDRRERLPPKRRAAGRAARLALLERAWRVRLEAYVDERPKPSNRDDVVDAMAVCWTAERVLRGRAVRLPEPPPRDARGLAMEILR